MRKINHYSPKFRGYLPIRVLNNNFANWFIEISPTFKMEYYDEVKYRGLNEKIIIDIRKSEIKDIAQIDKNGIKIYENFNQYLWSICYSIIVIFDLGIQEPSINKTFDGLIRFNTIKLRNAKKLFDHSFSLFSNYNTNKFFSLPNPEKYTRNNQFYIERANGVYSAAMVFILLHEFGHQYYGHLENYSSNSEEAKKDEFLVDDYAFDLMERHFQNIEGKTYKAGIVLGLGSLVLLDKTLDGGNEHPDSHSRLLRQIEKMNLSEIDNTWGIACVLINLWGIKYNIAVTDRMYFEHYKDMFYHQMEILNGL